MSGTASAQEFTGRDYIHATLLNRADIDVRLAATSLHRFGSGNPEIYDILAEVAWSACSGKRNMDSDALSWLGKTLGNTRDGRYSALLSYCISKVNDDKVTRYMEEARGKLQSGTTGSFEGGKLDPQQLRNRLMRQSALATRSHSTKTFDELRKNQTLEETFALLGPPTSISTETIPGKKVGPIGHRVQTSAYLLVFGYGPLGTIRFTDEVSSTDWVIVDAKSERPLFWSNNVGRFVVMNEVITNGNGSQLRELSIYLLEQSDRPTEILDRLAQRLYKSHQDEQLADGLAWLCKVFARSGNGRYKSVLLEVADTTTSKKVKEYANKTARGLPDIPGDRFVPSK